MKRKLKHSTKRKQKKNWTRAGAKEYGLYIQFVKNVEKLEALRRLIFSLGLTYPRDGSSPTELDYASIAIYIGRTENLLSSLSGLAGEWEKKRLRSLNRAQKKSMIQVISDRITKNSKPNYRDSIC